MSSQIDVTKPTTGTATTQSVRDNFTAMVSEIETLQGETGIHSIAASVAANALTVALKTSTGSDATSATGVEITFRNATATTGTRTNVSAVSALNVVVPQGATLGYANAATDNLYIYALNNAGTVEVGISATLFDEGTLKSSTAVSSNADSSTTLYSTTARTNVGIRLLGRVTVATGATAGDWSAAPTEINSSNNFSSASDAATITIDDTNLVVNSTTNLQTYLEGVDHALLKARGTGVSSTYVSTVSVGGTTFAQPTVDGEINSDQGYFHVTYAGATGITLANTSAASTYVYIDNANALQQQTSIPTRQDWSRKMFVMRIAVDLSSNTIIGFEYLNNPLGQYGNSLRDIYKYLLLQGVPFKDGQTVTGRAGDLGFDIAAGSFLEYGGTGDINNANIKSLSAVANASFYIATRTAQDAGGNTNLPKFWDNAGTLTALGSTTVVGHRIYRFSNGNVVLQYGQANYANMVLARAGVVLEEYVLKPSLKNATFLGWWMIESTATNTSGTTLTDFKEYTLGIAGGSSSGLTGAVLRGNNGSDFDDTALTRTNLGLGSAALTDTVQTFTASQIGEVTGLTDGASIATNLALSNNFSATLAGNRTLANPTNVVAGQSGSIFITQDGTGSRTLAYGGYFKFVGGTAPVLSTAAASVDRIDYVVASATQIHAVVSLDVK
jgi:hypothetical protein